MPQWIQTLTVDSSYHAPRLVTGIGIIVQQRMGVSGRGPIVDRIAEAHAGVPPGDGEMFAVLRALELASECRFSRIKIRSDCNPLRRKLREKFRAGHSGSGLEGRVLALARTYAWLDFGYVPRRKNQIAHALARSGRTQAASTLTRLDQALPVQARPVCQNSDL